jgi:hypothetical protein
MLAQYVAGAVACSSHFPMSNIFTCVELQRLKQQYQAALRIWDQFEFPLHNEPVGPPARHAGQLQLKQRALNARNEASERLLAVADPDPPPAVACLQPEMEAWDRSRKPGQGYERCDSVGRMTFIVDVDYGLMERSR